MIFIENFLYFFLFLFKLFDFFYETRSSFLIGFLIFFFFFVRRQDAEQRTFGRVVHRSASVDGLFS